MTILEKEEKTDKLRNTIQFAWVLTQIYHLLFMELNRKYEKELI